MQQQYDAVCQHCLSRLLESKAIANFDQLTDGQLQTFFSNFYHIVEQFPKQLGLLIFNAPNNPLLSHSFIVISRTSSEVRLPSS